MNRFEIETYIEEVIEEGRDPRDTSFELVDRFRMDEAELSDFPKWFQQYISDYQTLKDLTSTAPKTYEQKADLTEKLSAPRLRMLVLAMKHGEKGTDMLDTLLANAVDRGILDTGLEPENLVDDTGKILKELSADIARATTAEKRAFDIRKNAPESTDLVHRALADIDAAFKKAAKATQTGRGEKEAMELLAMTLENLEELKKPVGHAELGIGKTAFFNAMEWLKGKFYPGGEHTNLINQSQELLKQYRSGVKTEPVEFAGPGSLVQPVSATWKAAEGDIPVKITDYKGKGPDGKDYFGIEGSETGIPMDDLDFGGAAPKIKTPPQAPEKPSMDLASAFQSYGTLSAEVAQSVSNLTQATGTKKQIQDAINKTKEAVKQMDAIQQSKEWEEFSKNPANKKLVDSAIKQKEYQKTVIKRLEGGESPVEIETSGPDLEAERKEAGWSLDANRDDADEVEGELDNPEDHEEQQERPTSAGEINAAQKKVVDADNKASGKDGEATADSKALPSATSIGGQQPNEAAEHDKFIQKNWKRFTNAMTTGYGTTKDFLTKFGLNVISGEKPKVYAGICAGLVVGVVIKFGIGWVKNRHIRRVSILATNKAMMMADMEGLAVTPKALRNAFKMMTKSPLVQGKIKRYLARGKSVGQQYQALDNVANYIARELITYVKRSGVAKVTPRFNVPMPGNPPSVRGYIHPPGFADAVGFPDSGVGGDQEGTEFPGGSFAS